MVGLIWLVVAALCLTAHAARPMTAHDVNALRKVGSFAAFPSLDNDGTVTLVYSVQYWNETDNVKTTNLQMMKFNPSTNTPGQSPQSLTFTYGKSDSAPVVGRDGQVIGFVSSRSGSSQLWVVSPVLGQGSMQQVTNYPIGIDNVKWNRDSVSDFITFSARVYPDCVTGDVLTCTAQKDAAINARGPNIGIVYDSLYVRHWDKWVDGKVSHIFKQQIKVSVSQTSLQVSTVGNAIDLMAGMYANSPVPPFGGAEQYDVSADGQQVAFTVETVDREMAWHTGWKTMLVKLNPQDPTHLGKPVLISNTKARTQNPAFHPSGKYVAYLAMDRPGDESDRLHFVFYNLVSGQTTTPSIVFDRSVAGYAFSTDGTQIVLDTDNNGAHSLFSVQFDATNAQLSNVRLVVPDGSNTAAVQISGVSGWFFLRHTFLQPAGIFYSPSWASLPLVSVTGWWENQQLQPVFNLSVPESFTFVSDNNKTVQGWFFAPYGWTPSQSRSAPLSFLIHGGPEGAWSDGFSFRWNPQLWAAHGYAVVAINPTGSTGFGQAFTDAVRGDWGGAPYRDLMNGLSYILRQKPWIDGNRACACGGSYGGYMVNWMNSQTNAFKCFVNHDGTFSVSGKYYSTDEIFFQEWEFFGPPFDPNVAEIWKKWNPANYAASMATPMLVIHGGLDYRVPITEGISTFTNLQRRGVPSRLLYFPLENHWVLNPNNAIMWNDQVLGWLDQWTNNTPPPSS